MTLAILDLSNTGTAQTIQENLIAYMRLFEGLPNVITVDNAETFWFVSHKPAPGNIILKTRFSTDRAESQMDALLEQVGQHIDELGWFVYPGDQPIDLGSRLEARGMPGDKGGNWLWIDLAMLGAAPVVPDNFHIEQVRDDHMMAEWTRVSEAGFGIDVSIFYDAYARHGYGDDAFSLHYIGYMDDTPVTSGTLLDAGGGATIYDISTPPDFRGQGFGGAITHALMQETRNRGYGDTWIWSSNMAQSLYRKLGYIDADFGVRAHPWHR